MCGLTWEAEIRRLISDGSQARFTVAFLPYQQYHFLKNWRKIPFFFSAPLAIYVSSSLLNISANCTSVLICVDLELPLSWFSLHGTCTEWGEAEKYILPWSLNFSVVFTWKRAGVTVGQGRFRGMYCMYVCLCLKAWWLLAFASIWNHVFQGGTHIIMGSKLQTVHIRTLDSPRS